MYIEHRIFRFRKVLVPVVIAGDPLVTDLSAGSEHDVALLLHPVQQSWITAQAMVGDESYDGGVAPLFKIFHNNFDAAYLGSHKIITYFSESRILKNK